MNIFYKIYEFIQRNIIIEKIYKFILKYPFYLILSILLIFYTYKTISVFYPIDSYISDEVWYASSAYNIFTKIFRIPIEQYVPFPEGKNLENYFNLEHPPLAKYIIGFFIFLFGYTYWAWRIPSWIIGNLIVILSFLITRKIVGENVFGNIAGIIVAALIMSDPNIWIMHGIAMLDIYLAFFSLLSIYYLLKDKIILSSISYGLALSSKLPAVFLIFPFLYYITKKYNERIKRLIYGILIPFSVYVILNIPLLVYFGLTKWFYDSFLHGFEWGITSGHISDAPNQVSKPWQWLLNINPFYFGTYYSNVFYANVNIYFMILWLVTIPIMFLVRDNKIILVGIYPLFMYFGYILIYILGNDTLFSFYVSQFMPLIYIYVISSLFLLGLKYYYRDYKI